MGALIAGASTGGAKVNGRRVMAAKAAVFALAWGRSPNFGIPPHPAMPRARISGAMASLAAVIASRLAVDAQSTPLKSVFSGASPLARKSATLAGVRRRRPVSLPCRTRVEAVFGDVSGAGLCGAFWNLRAVDRDHMPAHRRRGRAAAHA